MRCRCKPYLGETTTTTDDFSAPEGANPAATPQPDPVRGGRSCTILVVRDLMDRCGNDLDDVIAGVVRDLIARDAMGFEKYGQNLETNDGRDTLMDWYQETLDAAQYGCKYLEEHPGEHLAERAYQNDLTTCVRLRQLIDERKPDNAPSAAERMRNLLDNPPWTEVETEDDPLQPDPDVMAPDFDMVSDAGKVSKCHEF